VEQAAKSVTAGTSADDFLKDHTDAITATGLSNADVKTMFSAVTLKGTIDTLHTDVKARRASSYA
jgi:hypothetical protein